MGKTSGNKKQEERDKLYQAEAFRLLDTADQTLSEVEACDFCQKVSARSFPKFEKDEVELGPLLGVGGFCMVYEIETFRLKEDDEEQADAKSTGDSAADGINKIKEPSEDMDLDNHADGEHHHYEVDMARKLMSNNVRRNEDARYAIKRLHKKLNPFERARGKLDLAIEVKFLSRLWHPNIIKMRGYSAGPLLNKNFFIILDRLYETLDQRIKDWEEDLYPNGRPNFIKKLFVGRKGGHSKATQIDREHLERDILLQQMIVAYDLSAAFLYMHENHLVYRDIKQLNIGFDVRGDVKVFDFGLCKGLSKSLRARDEKTGKVLPGYKLTGRTGSVPYMAPEVAERKPYDTKADVFSFAILLWEIFSMRICFPRISFIDYMDRVVMRKERPKISKNLPGLTRTAIQESWEHDPKKRPDMKRVSSMLRGDLNSLSTDEEVINRTKHMRDRSNHSARLRRMALEMAMKQQETFDYKPREEEDHRILLPNEK